jgi:hypothetical protein
MRGLLLACLVLAAGCSDPVNDDAQSALGGEKPGVPKGPLHRPGQPCLVCHGGWGPASPVFSLAGTVYQNEGGTTPIADALVKLIDSKGRVHQAVTNCAGNFFVMQADFDPAFPVWAKVVFGQLGGKPFEKPMGSPIYREGSCGKCHSDPRGPTSPGHVYVASALEPLSFPVQCQP